MALERARESLSTQVRRASGYHCKYGPHYFGGVNVKLEGKALNQLIARLVAKRILVYKTAQQFTY